jgi:hypothetical protein
LTMSRFNSLMAADKKSCPKIFMGLLEIAGYYTSLERGFRKLNVYARHIDAYGHSFTYKQSESNRYLNSVKRIGMHLRKISGSQPFRRLILMTIHKVLLIPVFLWALIKFDVFIFSFGTSFFYYLDLPVLKAFGKKVIYIFHGSDTRAPYLNGFSKSIPDPAILHRLTSKKKKIIAKIEKYADDILSYPLYAHLNCKKLVNNLFIGLPASLLLGRNR